MMMTQQERFRCIVKGCIIIWIAAWLCFRSVIVCGAGLIFLPYYMKKSQEDWQRKRQMKIQKEFKDAMAIFYSSTAAGGTLSKAIQDTTRDMRDSAGDYQFLLPEFNRMCIEMSRNVSLEDILMGFGSRCRDEDIMHFVEILLIARKSGGTLSDMVRHAVDTMSLRMEINEEIETMLSGRKGELKIMLLVPAGILLYMNLYSADYMTVLYTTIIGRVIMAAALAVYLGAAKLGSHILDIQA